MNDCRYLSEKCSYYHVCLNLRCREYAIEACPFEEKPTPAECLFYEEPENELGSGCLDRHEGCHADCERYLQQKEAFEIRKAEREREKKINAFFCDVDRRKKRWYRNHKKRGTK